MKTLLSLLKTLAVKMSISLLIFFSFSLTFFISPYLNAQSLNARAAGIQEGDIIFMKSQTAQAGAIQEATGSRWTHVGIIVKNNNSFYVAEAIQPVKITPLTQFIGRSENREFKIYRFKYFDLVSMRTKLYSSISKYYGKNYDIYFEFSDSRIYCSELVYKVFMDVTHQEVGILQKTRELHLDGPLVRKLIEERLTSIGRKIDLDELIVTPATQMADSDLVLVKSSR